MLSCATDAVNNEVLATGSPLVTDANQPSENTDSQHQPSGKSLLLDVLRNKRSKHLLIFGIFTLLGSEDDGPIYSPVSPDQDSDDDYDDVGDIEQSRWSRQSVPDWREHLWPLDQPDCTETNIYSKAYLEERMQSEDSEDFYVYFKFR